MTSLHVSLPKVKVTVDNESDYSIRQDRFKIPVVAFPVFDGFTLTSHSARSV